MATVGDLGNPKNTWVLLYEQSVLNQFHGLLIEMNVAAQAMTTRYELLKYGEPEGPRRDFSFGREEDMRGWALDGVGTALIIGTDSLIKGVRKSAGTSQREDACPMLKDVKWEDAIRAGGNYVRHGDEWRQLYHNFCEQKGIPPWSLEDRTEVIQEFMQMLRDRQDRAIKSLEILDGAGIPLGLFLASGNNIWGMADMLLLTEVEASMHRMRQFVDSFYDRPPKKPKKT